MERVQQALAQRAIKPIGNAELDRLSTSLVQSHNVSRAYLLQSFEQHDITQIHQLGDNAEFDQVLDLSTVYLTKYFNNEEVLKARIKAMRGKYDTCTDDVDKQEIIVDCRRYAADVVINQDLTRWEVEKIWPGLLRL